MARGASELPSLLDAGLAVKTIEKYKKAWKDWLDWARNYEEVNEIPADPFFIAPYFNELVNEKKTRSFLDRALCGIRWAHIRGGLYSPTDHPFVKLAIEGAKRSIAKLGLTSSRKKEPISPELIHDLVKLYGSSDDPVKLRFLVICLLGFAGFMRISELLGLKVGDLKFKEYGLKRVLNKSKTD